MQTDVLPTTTTELRAAAVTAAINRLRNGDVVALPTETVYGLAADALKAEAVVKIFEAKERPRFDPLIVHLPDLDWLDRVAVVNDDVRELVGALGAQFWPGPLTMVLPRREIVPEIVTAGLETVAVRISAHPVFEEIVRGFGSPLAAPSANRFGRISPTSAQHVLEELNERIPLVVDGGPTVHGIESAHDLFKHRMRGFGSPLAAPSANRFGRISPTSAQHVLEELNERIPLVVDGGPTVHGIESTIVALRNGRIEVLRRGPITVDQLEPFGQVIVPEPGQRPEAPGQLPSHYAPSTRLILLEDISTFTPEPNQKCGLLMWSSMVESGRCAMIRQLSSRQDLREAAANLFRYLRELDQAGLDLIVAEKLPAAGLGAAINDRLERAAL